MALKDIMTFLSTAALLGALPVVAAAGSVSSKLDFDQGIDVSDILSKAKESAKHAEGKVEAAYIGGTREDRDCVTITLNPNDNPVSPVFNLRSTEWVTECRDVPSGPGQNYPPGYRYPPGQGYPPGYGYPPGQNYPPDGSLGNNCWERPQRTYQTQASVTLRDRQTLLPWEYDQFEVCQQGPWVDLRATATAYEYKTVRGGGSDGGFVLAPIRKLAMKPDPAGIFASNWNGTTLTLKDRWSSYYRGEATVLVVTLKKDVPLWFDAVVVEREIQLAPAETYVVNFMDYAGEFRQKLEAGGKYYAEYSFKRLGSVSRPNLTKGGETDKIVYHPAAPALAFAR